MTDADSKNPGGRILVVDDIEYNRHLLARRLGRRGFEVDTAQDGPAALEAVNGGDYALVLLDIMMPGMDGYEVLERLRERRSRTELPIIMVTAKDESADIVRALELGANDYVTKPIDFAVALARINTHLQVSRSETALRAAHARMKSDLEAAANTQRRLLPADTIDDPRIAFGWAYHPCDELGGDMLNVFRIDEDRVGMYLLDVSGHGVQAALLSFSAFRSLSPDANPGSIVLGPASGEIAAVQQVVQRVNAEYSMMANSGLIFTLVYAVVDLQQGTLSFVGAGHPDPVRVAIDGTVTMLKSVGGPPIGALDDARYEAGRIELSPGDRIVMVSDGVYEQFDEGRERFGWERYLNEVGASRSASTDAAATTIADAVARWAGSRGMLDDVSVLAFDYRP